MSFIDKTPTRLFSMVFSSTGTSKGRVMYEIFKLVYTVLGNKLCLMN